MPAKSSSPVKKNKTAAAPNPRSTIFYRLHALLHTIHAIERYEDQLCSLLHEIQTSGAVSEVVSEELRDLLEQIPSSGYQEEINAVREALAPSVPVPASPQRAPTKKAAARRSSVSRPK
ncbi:MAG: hypothetical protein ACRYFU_24785 [Janthinobacterium lividum]